MDSHEQIEHALTTVLSEPSSVRARHGLKKIVESSQQRIKLGDTNELLFRLAALGHAHLADLEDTAAKRAQNRALALRTCTEGLAINASSAILAATYANAVVDWFYDSFATRDIARLTSALAKAKKQCQKLLASETAKELRLQLLVQCASVLRCQSQLHGKQGGRGLVQQATRTSEAACRECPQSPLAILDLGLSYQALCRWAESETEHFEQMQKAESALLKAHSFGLPLATLCLARLYRQTYRPDKAIDWFFEYSKRETRRRIVLAESHIVAEAAVLLLHRRLEPHYVRDRLLRIQLLLSEAINAGYRNARLLVSLARIRFSLEDSLGGTSFLREITKAETTDWKLAIEEARNAIEADDLDLLYRAFALGMTEGAVWNSLGTFAKDVLNDPVFAIRLYKTGLQLSPKSPVLHTNIARIYLESLDDVALPEVKRHLDAACEYADFSFRWWKPLYDTLYQRLEKTSSKLYGYKTSSDSECLDLIYSQFVNLESGASEATSRGNQVANLFVRVLRLTYGTENVTGSLNLDDIQSDASFKHGENFYRAEISWDSRPNDRSEVGKLNERLDRDLDTRGLLVSMSGFTSGVTDELRRQKPKHVIFLIDRVEFRLVLQGETRLESLIEEKEKQWYFRQPSKAMQS